MDRDSIRQQFGANAATYVTSRPHAQGASLARLVELAAPGPDWDVLDVASATGHTAFAFAPHVHHVWSTDITPEMLELARQQAAARGVANVSVEHADAEALPFPDGRFHLVTCRIAPHHFVDIAPFLRESARVLRPGGLLAVVDNVVPAGAAGDYINAFEKFRDPSHGRCLSMDEWRAAYLAAGFSVLHEEVLIKPMVFEEWAGRHHGLTQRYLRAMLTEVSGGAADFLRPEVAEGKTIFHLEEGILIGQTQG